ncbi:MAG: hypothetical protein A9Z00_09170 [Thermobacillus sp. ZCTH02-B1]|uniref:ABC transporter substrate-binding protein n=1 Tax=Thermobacillus sp. ZCTH02-B1 TaxID=1858795 RepID=UPI000B582DF5|nr:extracellular solute-binding protein [Thermobacillus sp. ZCTH02-B1]OUM94855.1 MAG: hypothetical protein A9Z00_09170 [Thermobacillus sp. ZCTH02-B1]
MKRCALTAVLVCLLAMAAACRSVPVIGEKSDESDEFTWQGTLRLGLFTMTKGPLFPYEAGTDPIWKPMIQERLKDFMEAHPGVQIEVVDIHSGPGWLETVLNDPDLRPDVVELTPYQAWRMADQLMNLTDWIHQETGWTGAYAELAARMSPDEGTLLLPLRVIPWIVFYDPEQFRELGIPEPAEDWTIYDFVETAQRLAEAGRPVGSMGGLEAAERIVRAWGGRYTSPDGGSVIGWMDSEETVDAFVRYAQLVPAGLDSGDPKELPALGMWEASSLRNLYLIRYADYGIGPTPKVPDGERINVAKMSGLAVLKDSEHPYAALDLLKWLIGRNDEEALTFVADHTLDTVSESFTTSPHASVAALKERMREGDRRRGTRIVPTVSGEGGLLRFT